MAFDEGGQAELVERRLAIAGRAVGLLREQAGFEPEDIIIDPNIFAIGTGIEEHAGYAVAFIESVRRLKAEMPGVLTSGGVSNVSFSFRGNDPVREAIHAVFLYHAISAGLDMAIVNAGALPVLDDLDPDLRERVEDLVLDRRPDATERLLEIADAARSAAAGDVRDLSWVRPPSTSASRTSSWRASPTGSSRTPRRPDLRRPGRWTSSRARAWRAWISSETASAAVACSCPRSSSRLAS